MMEPAFLSQLGGFLGDLRFLACACALCLYGVWLVLRRPGLVGMARLGLVIGFGATVLSYAVGKAQIATLPFADYFLFALLAMFLLLEFLFQMSVLGAGVAAVSAAVAGFHYLWPSSVLPLKPPDGVQAYWWLLRDLCGTTGLAALTLSLGTALVLYVQPQRRSSVGKLVHPNDLRDVAALLARLTLPCFLFALAFQGVALAAPHGTSLANEVGLGTLLLALALAVAWVLQAESRRFGGTRVLGLVLANALALAVYCSGPLVVSTLTAGHAIP